MDQPNKTVLDAISKSGTLGNWLGDQLDGRTLPGSLPDRLAGAFWHVSLQHHLAIGSLVQEERLASAFALLRPLIDAYVRGLWVAHLASEIEIQGFTKGDDPPDTGKLVKRLETEGWFKGNNLSQIKQGIWPVLCDATHTGIRMVSCHLSDAEIGPVFDDEEILDLLGASDAWALMAAGSIASLMGDEALQSHLLDRTRMISRSSERSGPMFGNGECS